MENMRLGNIQDMIRGTTMYLNGVQKERNADRIKFEETVADNFPE